MNRLDYIDIICKWCNDRGFTSTYNTPTGVDHSIHIMQDGVWIEIDKTYDIYGANTEYMIVYGKDCIINMVKWMELIKEGEYRKANIGDRNEKEH